VKSFLLYIAFLALLLVFLPAAVVGGWWRWEKAGQVLDQPAERDAGTGESAGESITLKIYQAKKNELVEMEMEEYLKGVVSAEMPASFHLEALKAQAVVARRGPLHGELLLPGLGRRKRVAPEMAGR
jgi:stage II sporulation protein D